MKKQLIIVADMEGASGIFEENREALFHEELYQDSALWRDLGRSCITSDVLAVCEAANAFGIDEIMLCDMHFAGCAESNIEIEKLPSNVRMFDTHNREIYWSRIRGQAAWEPFGIITVGQHARNGEENAYFPHTIHTPPIEAFYVNGIHTAEIGQAVMSFCGTPYIANIGCAASHKEAKELSANVSCISVKDKSTDWKPTEKETFSIIYNGVLEALDTYEDKTAFNFEDDYVCCELILSDGYYFEEPDDYPWTGVFEKNKATWKALNIEAALDIFWYVHGFIKKPE